MDDRKELLKTTLYIPRDLKESTQIMAILTRTSLSNFMCISLRDKIKQLKEKK